MNCVSAVTASSSRKKFYNICFCFQANIKHAKDELGMTVLMRENPTVKRIVQLCCSIPIAPHNHMRSALREITAEARATIYFQDLLPYFWYIWETWLTGPRYLRLSVSGCEHRSNNICESFNRLLAGELGPHHPNVYRFIGNIIYLLCIFQQIFSTKCRVSFYLLLFLEVLTKFEDKAFTGQSSLSLELGATFLFQELF